MVDSVKLGTSSPGTFKLGSSQVAKIYRGLSVVWQNILAVMAVVAYQNVTASAVTPTNSTARSRFTATGLQQSKIGGAAYVNNNTWLRAGSASDYSIRATVAGQSGTSGTHTGTTGTWVGLGSDFELTVVSGPSGNYWTVEFTIEIKLNSSGAVLSSNTVSLTSDRI